MIYLGNLFPFSAKLPINFACLEFREDNTSLSFLQMRLLGERRYLRRIPSRRRSSLPILYSDFESLFHPLIKTDAVLRFTNDNFYDPRVNGGDLGSPF